MSVWGVPAGQGWPRSPYAVNQGIDTDGLIGVIAPDPTVKRDFFTIVGLIGKAPQENHWRIYVNWALSEYYEFFEEDIIYLLPIGDERTRFWVKNRANVRHVIEDPTRAEEVRYLTGPIAERARWPGDDQWSDGWGPEPSKCAQCPTRTTNC